ncbi:subclass B3 metallo-beta-lactamase [Qipengyuania sediminis]|uniref:subclass B3 metallo-beta-lactamase n=1 Tax=Qipengyuania sediminis TaxID=1532023 RepID=UPI001F10EEDA|nr:subclass B3 metallo-beta-lactamase [Qipengyuania sediminis]
MSYIARMLLAALGCVFLAACATTSAAPLADAAPGQRAWVAACEGRDGWDEPGPPFHIHGSTYYVGTCGIAALLVASPDGHTLIDSGTHDGALLVYANIRALGFKPHDVKTILMSHEHFDHIGGIARLQNLTGATIVASAPAVQVLVSGRPAADDPQAASGHPPFPPATGRIEVLTDQRRAELRKRGFIALTTPGHTPGALSWTWPACEGGRCKQIVYADSLNPISAEGYRFSDRPALVAAFREGIAKVADWPCDILLAPHPAAAALRERLSGAAPLIYTGGCRAYAARASARLDARLASEAGGG